MLRIKTHAGYYEVAVGSSKGVRAYFVDKSKSCTCGKDACGHVDAVAAYLKAGGQRAKEATRDRVRAALLLGACPICTALTDNQAVWRCSRGGYKHYFQWLDETVHKGAVRKWHTEHNAAQS
jgi:hypothetical protein